MECFVVSVKTKWPSFVTSRECFTLVRVNEEHRELFTILWWTNGETLEEPEEYRMKVHLFGTTSYEEQYGSAAANFLRNYFYVDDQLKSTSTIEEDISLVKHGASAEVETLRRLTIKQQNGFISHKGTGFT